MRLRTLALLLLAATWADPVGAAEEPVQEVLVRVAPAGIGRRLRDERPAEFRLEPSAIPAGRNLDPASLQVLRWDEGRRKAVGQPLPLRWYDDAIPYEFPECDQNIHATDGRTLVRTPRPRWGDYYNLRGAGAGGRLVWIHTQEGNNPAMYALQFRLLPSGERPAHLAPRGFVGDGSHRCAAVGGTSTSVIHSRVAAADWNADGLIDLLVGGARGHVLLYPNAGTKAVPRFAPPSLLMTEPSLPLDVGWSAAPCAVDWDGDGRLDLLSGAERNRIVYFRNEGTREAPRLVPKGFVHAGERPLELPVTPVPKSPEGVYALDYYPVPEAVDWNGDGRTDLLAGGYITGRVYFYENVARAADGTPRLEYRGPLESDGRPLNVGDWAAAPSAADIDGDGDLDLFSGNLPLNAGGGDSVEVRSVLRYYENVGTRTAPRLAERPFPRQGDFPATALGTPRTADLNGDGRLDLVVSAGEQVWLFNNVGTPTQPLFAVQAPPLPSEWGSAPLPTWGVQFLDWNGDGRQDILSGLGVHLNRGDDRFESAGLLPPGNTIQHPAPRGDGWTFTQIADLDGDGERDLLYGTHEGNVWLHRSQGGASPRFDETGERLCTGDGKPIQVGPAAGQKVDFDVLQGARTAFSVADLDRDGRLDLVVGDTYGKVRVYRNAGEGRNPSFAAAIELGDMQIRMIPYAADWDGDGNPDVVGSSADGKVRWWRNLGGGRFDGGRDIPMPAVCYSPFAAAVDWNRDGDLDLMVSTAYGYTCWFDRSFLDDGYAEAKALP